MIFDDGRQMLRLEVIDTGFFDEDMTLEPFGDEGEPGCRRHQARAGREGHPGARVRRAGGSGDEPGPRPARRMGAGGTRRPGL